MEFEISEWLETRCNEIVFFRDASKPLRIKISFCYESTGCPGEIEAVGLTTYEAINMAIEEQQK